MRIKQHQVCSREQLSTEDEGEPFLGVFFCLNARNFGKNGLKKVFCCKVSFAGVALEAVLRRIGGSAYFGDGIIEQETDSIPHDYILSYYYEVLEKSGEMKNARCER